VSKKKKKLRGIQKRGPFGGNEAMRNPAGGVRGGIGSVECACSNKQKTRCGGGEKKSLEILATRKIWRGTCHGWGRKSRGQEHLAESGELSARR